MACSSPPRSAVVFFSTLSVGGVCMGLYPHSGGDCLFPNRAIRRYGYTFVLIKNRIFRQQGICVFEMATFILGIHRHVLK